MGKEGRQGPPGEGGEGGGCVLIHLCPDFCPVEVIFKAAVVEWWSQFTGQTLHVSLVRWTPAAVAD